MTTERMGRFFQAAAPRHSAMRPSCACRLADEDDAAMQIFSPRRSRGAAAVEDDGTGGGRHGVGELLGDERPAALEVGLHVVDVAWSRPVPPAGAALLRREELRR